MTTLAAALACLRAPPVYVCQYGYKDRRYDHGNGHNGCGDGYSGYGHGDGYGDGYSDYGNGSSHGYGGSGGGGDGCGSYGHGDGDGRSKAFIS